MICLNAGIGGGSGSGTNIDVQLLEFHDRVDGRAWSGLGMAH
jgi:hypothetical protein